MVEKNIKLFKNALKNPQELIGYDKNSRKHSADQIGQIKKLMNEIGFTNPVLLREDGKSIIAGHARVEAALQLGITQIPCVILDGLTVAQIRAYIIADNQIALNAEWDFDILKQELQELDNEGFDIDLLGFSEKELKELEDMHKIPDFKPLDEYPNPPASKNENNQIECPSCGLKFKVSINGESQNG